MNVYDFAHAHRYLKTAVSHGEAQLQQECCLRHTK